MATARRDTLTHDLFEVPVPAAATVASMDYRATVAELLAEMLKDSGVDRYEAAAQASRLTGKEVSKYMLDAYTSPAREEFNAPAWLMPVLESVCKSHLYSSWIADIRGGRLYLGRDALKAELGRLEHHREELAKTIREVKRRLGEEQ